METQARNQNQMAMFLHLSLLAGLIVPFAGFVLPILIWQLKKEEMPELDPHGKVVVNWIISSLIYAAVMFVLVFVLIGIPLLIALAVLGIIFTIVGGIKDNDGIVWKYPLSIAFLR